MKYNTVIIRLFILVSAALIASSFIRGQSRVRISAILVATEAEAQQIIEKLGVGADFAQLARQHSIGPGKDDGGDLGFFNPGEMLAELEAEVNKLQVGQYSGVIKTGIGYFVLLKSDESFEVIKDKFFDQMKLLAAVKRGDTDTVRALLKAGADANARDVVGMTALMHAALPGHTGIVDALLEAGADVNANVRGMTVLAFAVSDFQHPSRTMLGAEYDNVPDQKDHTVIVKALLEAGAEVNAGDRETEVGTAIILAARNGYTSTVQALLAAGADVNAKTNDGLTALMQAAEWGHVVTVQNLLEAGAAVNAIHDDGSTALIVAAQNGHTEIVLTLLELGADLKAKYYNGATALMVAAQNGHTTTTQALLEAGADVNAEAKGGRTAMSIAEAEGHTEVVQLLKQAGAKK